MAASDQLWCLVVYLLIFWGTLRLPFWFSVSLSMWKRTCDLSMVYICVRSLDKVLPAVASTQDCKHNWTFIKCFGCAKEKQSEIHFKRWILNVFTTNPLPLSLRNSYPGTFFLGFFGTLKLGCANIVVLSDNPLKCKNTSHNWKDVANFKNNSFTFFLPKTPYHELYFHKQHSMEECWPRKRKWLLF